VKDSVVVAQVGVTVKVNDTEFENGYELVTIVPLTVTVNVPASDPEVEYHDIFLVVLSVEMNKN